jgi:hypothetical protein
MPKRDTIGERRQVAEWSGMGQLTHDDRPLGPVRYAIVVFETFHLVRSRFLGSKERVAGPQEMVFWVDHGRIDMWPLMGVTLTLHLEEGRRVDVTHDGSRFVAAGQIRSLRACAGCSRIRPAMNFALRWPERS